MNQISITNIKKLREETGVGLSEANATLEFCENDVEVAKEFIRLKTSAVYRYKIVDGVKVQFTDNDYLELAKQNAAKMYNDINNKDVEIELD